MTSEGAFPILVSTGWLYENLDAPDVKVLDASSYLPTENRDCKAEFEREHISGAVFFDLENIVDSVSPLPHTVPNAVDFSNAVSALGISNADRVVIYDTSPFFSAPRAWWMFRHFGHEKVAVLDGGLPQWKRDGYQTEHGPVYPEGDTYIARENKDILADIDMVREAVATGGSQLADARGRGRFTGEETEFRPGLRSGHMPGARNIPYGTLIGADGLFLPPDEIRKRFEDAGIDIDRPVITTCGSGVTAAVLSFGLALLGRESRLYDGSWTEWGGRTDTPVATGPEKPVTKKSQSTRIVTAGQDKKRNQGIVNTPVFHASTVLFPTMEDLRHAVKNRDSVLYYGRRGTPTTFTLCEALAEVEGGAGTVLYPSGMAAISGALLAFLKAGDHLLMVDSVYEPTRSFCDRMLKGWGIETTYYDPRIGAGISGLMRDNTKVVFTEAPGSLTFDMQDIPAIAEAAHAGGAIVMMDNTWASPLFFKPFRHGVDISIQALTKYVVGHSDAMLGSATATQECLPQLREGRNLLGDAVGPDDVYLATRGLRTLEVRLRQHEANALRIARWFEGRPEVARVLHPALESHPDHAVWKRDFLGSSGLFSIVLQEGSQQAIDAMVDGYRYFGLGFSWGGFESLALPANPASCRTAVKWQAEGPLIRYHIGLEDPHDLIADLEEGFERLRQAGA